jgi:hypothetical protein
MPKPHRQTVRLPKGWNNRVRSAILDVIALATYSLTVAQGRAREHPEPGSRPTAACQRLQQEVLLLREELRLKDARMAHLPQHRRPHYPPTERRAILDLRATHSWSLAQTRAHFW